MLAGMITLGVLTKTPHISLLIDELQDESQSLIQARIQISQISSETDTSYSNANDGAVTLSFHLSSIDGVIPSDQGVTFTIGSGDAEQVAVASRETNVQYIGFNAGWYDITITDHAINSTYNVGLNIGYGDSPSYITYKNANYAGTGSIYFVPVLYTQQSTGAANFTVTNIRGGFARVRCILLNHEFAHSNFWSDDEILTNGSILYTGRYTKTKAANVTFTEGNYTITTNNSGVVTLAAIYNIMGRNADLGNFNGYVTAGFPLTALFVKSCGLSPQSVNVIKMALDHWSNILRNTTLPAQSIPDEIYDGQNWVPNPLVDQPNQGYVVCINKFTASSYSTLAAASFWYIRAGQEDENTKHYWLPSVGFFFINTPHEITMLNNITPSGKTELYNTVLHEMGHAFGLGTAWFYQQNASLYRSFIVNAGDESVNSSYGPLGNIFYSTDRGDGSRTSAHVGTFVNKGDASFPYAYNPYSTMGNNSLAVSAYNSIYNNSLSAIPLENGLGSGSYGGHWHEGLSTNYQGGTGDVRQYYGVTYPGAPALQDEMMTPISENNRDVPLSKISLGAMADLGWVVDHSLADKLEPFMLSVRKSSFYPDSLTLKRNNFGGFSEAYDHTNEYYNVFSSIRRGHTIIIKNETGDTLELITWLGVPITSNVTQTTINGVPCITWTVPTNMTAGDYVVLVGQRLYDAIILEIS